MYLVSKSLWFIEYARAVFGCHVRDCNIIKIKRKREIGGSSKSQMPNCHTLFVVLPLLVVALYMVSCKLTKKRWEICLYKKHVFSLLS